MGVSARDTPGVRGVGASHGVEECLPLHLAGRSLEFRRVSFERESVIKKAKGSGSASGVGDRGQGWSPAD